MIYGGGDMALMYGTKRKNGTVRNNGVVQNVLKGPE